MPHDHHPGCGCGHHHSALPDPHAVRADGQVSLTGQLACRDMGEMLAVLGHAQFHIDASRAEAGCLQFDLRQTEDPLVFEFAELFTDEAAYRAHQERTRASEWGTVTRDIPRQAYDRQGVSE